MNLKPTLILLCSCLLAAGACAKPCRVVWTEGPTDPDTGKATHQMNILNPPSGTDWTLWFCQFRTPIQMEEGAPASIDHLAGTLYRVVPGANAGKDGMLLRYQARPLVNQCRAPEGFYLQRKGGKPVPVPVEYVFLPADPVPGFEWKQVDVGVYDIVPRLKSVTALEGTTDLKDCTPARTLVQGQPEGWYRLTLDGEVGVEASGEDGFHYAEVTLANLRRNSGDGVVPSAVVEDWPDLPYRGLMLDVSRNFTSKDNLLRLIDLLDHYKVNHLHLHFGDDEGWRIAIDGLDELTSYGAFRGLPVLREDGSFEEPDALIPCYCGTPDRSDRASSGNGFYSREDFVQILKYAWERRIHVVPEFDTPGHSRAAIKSMEYRARTTGDTAFLLSEPEDNSVYVSVQDYTDNAINVALPSTYALIDKVFDGLIALYAEAGAPLDAIHVGGDEVPEGAWKGSPACQALLESLGKSDVGALKDYYVSRVLDIAEAKGVKVAGWQELCQHLEPATFDRLRKNIAFTNLWAVSHGRDKLAYTLANQGVPVVLSNSSNAYFDLAYNYSKTERGHSWAGFIDERRSFSFLPYDIYRSVRWDDKGRPAENLDLPGAGKPVLAPEGRPFILGVQGQLWTETIRSFDHVTYYLFPKAAGLFERGWNASPDWAGSSRPDDPAFTADFDRFFSTVTAHEYPYYESLGISWHRH